MTSADLPALVRQLEKQNPVPAEVQNPALYDCPTCGARKRLPSEACWDCGTDAQGEW